MRSFLALIFFGLIGGIVGSYFFASFNNSDTADIFRAVTPMPTISATPYYGIWEKIVEESSSSLVAIQVFNSNRLIKQGTGIIVSSDGLIATVGDLAISGAVYQVFYEDKIIKGKISATDFNLNLALIKTENPYSNVAKLSDDNYQVGQEVILTGKIIALSKPDIFSQKGMVSYITQKNVIIDTLVNDNLIGAGVISSRGDFLGLTYIRDGKIHMVRGTTIGDFFKTYSGR